MGSMTKYSIFAIKRQMFFWPENGYTRFTKSHGTTEGFHTKMEMISRHAYGFRNFSATKRWRIRPLAVKITD